MQGTDRAAGQLDGTSISHARRSPPPSDPSSDLIQEGVGRSCPVSIFPPPAPPVGRDRLVVAAARSCPVMSDPGKQYCGGKVLAAESLVNSIQRSEEPSHMAVANIISFCFPPLQEPAARPAARRETVAKARARVIFFALCSLTLNISTVAAIAGRELQENGGGVRIMRGVTEL